MSIIDLERTPVHGDNPTPGRARGQVVKPAPESESDSLWISVIDQADQHAYEVPPGNWQDRGEALPALGATCVMIFDHYGDAWVPVWEGVTSIPSVEDIDAFDPVGAAAAAQAAAEAASMPVGTTLDQVPGATADVNLHGHKLTHVADGLVGTDAATVEQVTSAVGLLIAGAGAPGDGVGVNGQFYLDGTSLRFYGPKAGGHWPAASGRLLPIGAATWAEIESG